MSEELPGQGPLERQVRPHTPGPWAFAEFHDSPNSVFVQWPYGYAEVNGSRAGRESNARLIVAAPDLLAALQAVVSVADRATVEFDMAHAAIAKALDLRPNVI